MPPLASPIFPGSFDPPQLGHVDVARRALALFGRLTVAIGTNSSKSPIFSVDERLQLLREILGDQEGLCFERFDGLLVDHCRTQGYDVVVRGVRGGRDLEYEMPMALTNRAMLPGLETIFLATAAEHAFTSSTLVKEILRAGGDASRFLPAAVLAAAQRKLPG